MHLEDPIDLKQLVKQGYKGKELGEKIDLERLEAIRNTPKPSI